MFLEEFVLKRFVLVLAMCGFVGNVAHANDDEGPQYSQRLRRMATRIATAAAYTAPVAAGLYAMESIPGAEAGPFTAAGCALACQIIETMGCGASAWVVGMLNPGVGIIYASICAATTPATVASCTGLCLAIGGPAPTP